jgi:DNA repair exonuclease SbcCD ATPase subunit
MAGKLEKAQEQYEKLLIELGNKAEMVNMLDKADPALLTAFQKAKDSLADRRLELEFIQGEIDSTNQNKDQRIEELKQEIGELKDSIKTSEKVIGVKKDKAAPLKTKLAGAEYDLKFVEKALEDEKELKKKAKEKEDWDKAKRCEEKIKATKIDILKRRGQLDQLRTEIRQFENPADQAKGSIDEYQEQIDAKEAELAELEEASGGELLKDLERQRDEKQRDVRRSEMHLEDTIADLGESLYEKRVPHPVLEKYYTDIDQVAAVIDKLQGAK